MTDKEMQSLEAALKAHSEKRFSHTEVEKLKAEFAAVMENLANKWKKQCTHYDTTTMYCADELLAAIPTDYASALDRMLAEARLEMYYALIRLPERSHEGACGPESGCDATCMDIANFDEYVSSLWKIIGKKRRSVYEIDIIAELRRAVKGETSAK